MDPEKIEKLQGTLMDIEDIFNRMTNKGEERPSNVKKYRGTEGIRQVNWNSTHAKNKKLYVIELPGLLETWGSKKQAEAMRREFVRNKIEIKGLNNVKKFQEFTNVKGAVDLWTPRYIDPKIFKNFKNSTDLAFAT